ncbi:MAG: hypothetical protein ACFN4K_05800 [Pauljensenia sp.]
MTRTIRQVEERLAGLRFAGRSYAGLSPEVASGDAARAVAEFEVNAPEDLAFVLARYREVQNAAVVAAADLSTLRALLVAVIKAGETLTASHVERGIDAIVERLVDAAFCARITEEDAGEEAK